MPYPIPSGVKEEARKGLRWRAKLGRGGTSVGLATARYLSDNDQASDAWVRKIAQYFPRHEVDKRGTGWSPGEEGYPSNGRIAWALWGGDAGQRWATAKRDQIDNEKTLPESAMLTKTLKLDQCEIKMTDANGAVKVRGYASTFGNIDSYGDTIVKGAFADTIKARPRPVPMLYQHAWDKVIGKYVHLEEDSRGLLFEGELTPGHSLAQDVAASLRHGSLDGFSIGFKVADDGMMMMPEDDEDAPKGVRRMLTKIDLKEISVVTFPADDSARLESVKQQVEGLHTLSEIEDYLRDACGLSRSAAKALLARTKAALRDAEPLDVKRIDPDPMSEILQLIETRFKP